MPGCTVGVVTLTLDQPTCLGDIATKCGIAAMRVEATQIEPGHQALIEHRHLAVEDQGAWAQLGDRAGDVGEGR
jgi:hypothetical protein